MIGTNQSCFADRYPKGGSNTRWGLFPAIKLAELNKPKNRDNTVVFIAVIPILCGSVTQLPPYNDAFTTLRITCFNLSLIIK